MVIGQGVGLRLGGGISREPAALHGTLLTIRTTPTARYYKLLT